MTTATVDKDQLLDEYVEALDAGDDELALEIARRMPLHPSLAKSILRDVGKETLMANFNLSEVNEFFGEGWMDEQSGKALSR